MYFLNFLNEISYKFLQNDYVSSFYATVKLAQERKTNVKYALKFYPKYILSDSNKMKNVKREINLLKKMDHPNIIKLLYAINDK